LLDESLKGSKSLKIFKISLAFRFDKLSHLSKSVHTGENSQILTVSNKKKYSSTNFTILIIGLFVNSFKKMLFINFEAIATLQLR
jgi:hypothetical protein